MSSATASPSTFAPGDASSNPRSDQPTRDQSQPSRTPPAGPGKPRDPFFDNAKFLAIVLVVGGHAIESLRDVRAAHAAYLFVSTFHMPVFIVITGYLSRNFSFSAGKARKLIYGLAVPYVIFEVAYSVYHWALGHAALKISLLDPYYLTWFLMALFAWRLSTPVWQQLRWPIGAAVLISLLSGMEQLPPELEGNRALGLAPFFVLGLFLKPKHFELLHRRAARVLGAVTVLGAFAFTYLIADRHMRTEWVYWRSGNAALGVDNLTGSVVRLGLLACAAVLVAAFLALVPARRTWFTHLGTATLYAYLLHGFVTKGVEYLGWYDIQALHTVAGVAGVAAVGGVLATLLCTPPVRRALRWAVEPGVGWAFAPSTRPDVTAQRPRADAATKDPSEPAPHHRGT
jgi:fucose 4-O-acetylase-like acetyltransferase